MIEIYYVIENTEKIKNTDERYLVVSNECVRKTLRLGKRFKLIKICKTKKEAYDLCSKLRKSSMNSHEVMIMIQQYKDYIHSAIQRSMFQK